MAALDDVPPDLLAEGTADVRRDALAIILATVDGDEEGQRAIMAGANHTLVFFTLILMLAEAYEDTPGQLAGWVREQQALLNN